MNIREFRIILNSKSRASGGFVVCIAFFLVGVLTGAISANYISDNNVHAIYDLLINKSSGYYEVRGFLSSLMSVFSYNAAAFFLGFLLFGFVLVPLLSGIRGFFLSFITSAIIRALGKGGLIFVFLRFGLPALITVPCFFVLSFLAFNASFTLTGNTLLNKSTRFIYDKDYFGRCAYCFSALIIAAIIEAYISPLIAALAR